MATARERYLGADRRTWRVSSLKASSHAAICSPRLEAAESRERSEASRWITSAREDGFEEGVRWNNRTRMLTGIWMTAPRLLHTRCKS